MLLDQLQGQQTFASDSVKSSFHQDNFSWKIHLKMNFYGHLLSKGVFSFYCCLNFGTRVNSLWQKTFPVFHPCKETFLSFHSGQQLLFRSKPNYFQRVETFSAFHLSHINYIPQNRNFRLPKLPKCRSPNLTKHKIQFEN